MKWRRLVWLVPLLLGGCATYRPLPLDLGASAANNPADIRVAASVLRQFPQARHRFNPGHGLDMTDVAILAVANNPKLKLARDERGIAHAQAFAAGLLPDPVLNLAHGVPTAGPSDISSFDLGLSYDVEAVLIHPWVERAASESAHEVDLDVLWMAWQVVGKARQLFIRNVYQAKKLAVLQQESEDLARQYAQLRHLGKDGGVPLTAVATDLAELQAVEVHLHAEERRHLKARHALDALLGLSPTVTLHLRSPATIPGLSAATIDRALAALPHRRPDLLALEAGYRSADARYRQAILEQFPAIRVGFSKGRDTDGIYSRNFRISLSLPIFNRNRGNIAIARATRKDLHDEFATRLAQARTRVEQIVEDRTLLARQRRQLQRAAASTQATLTRLEAVAKPGDVSAARLARLQTNVFDRRVDLLTVTENLLEQRVALRTLAGAGPPGNPMTE